MNTSMSKYTYRSELQGIPSKLNLHAIPKQDRNTVSSPLKKNKQS